LLTSAYFNSISSQPERHRSLVKTLLAHLETNIFTTFIRSSNSLILSGFKPEIKGLFPRTSVLRGHHYLLESRARHASRTTHPPPFFEIRPSRPAILYSTPHLTTNLTKHHSLNSALLRSLLIQHIRTGAINVPSRSQNVISSGMCPSLCQVRGPLMVAVFSKHAKKHDLPFRCSHISGCTSRFRYNKDLQRHCDTQHSTARVWYCPHPTCKYSRGESKIFKRKDNFDRHIRTVHGEAN
jgi:hypothetical protein